MGLKCPTVRNVKRIQIPFFVADEAILHLHELLWRRDEGLNGERTLPHCCFKLQHNEGKILKVQTYGCSSIYSNPWAVCALLIGFHLFSLLLIGFHLLQVATICLRMLDRRTFRECPVNVSLLGHSYEKSAHARQVSLFQGAIISDSSVGLGEVWLRTNRTSFYTFWD